MTNGANRNKDKQVVAKRALRKTMEAHKYAHHAESHEDKIEQRRLAEQAMSQWQGRRPPLRNLSDILRRTY